jgi:IMP dehydrogenase
MDGVVSPETAIAIGRLGGLAVLNLEGIWCRYEDADEQLARIATLGREEATREMQDIYLEPVKPELIRRRIEEIKQPGVVVAASLTPQKVEQYHEVALDAGSTSSSSRAPSSREHVSSQGPCSTSRSSSRAADPGRRGGCASYHTGPAPHALGRGRRARRRRARRRVHHARRARHRRPAGDRRSPTSPRRSQNMLETGEYCQVIADGGMRNGGDVAKAIACGATR